MLVYYSATSAWRDVVKTVRKYGKPLSSRVGGCMELLNVAFTVKNIEQNFVLDSVRRADPAYACAEFLWYMSGDNKSAMLEAYAPQYKNFAEDDGTCYGAYGPRIWRNLKTVIRLLHDDPHTRQAVLPIWRPDDLCLANRVKDMPCTVALQFLVREKKLHATATMRSNDVWLGLPYDMFCFTQLQRLVADELGLMYGGYHHQVGSMHIYDRDLAKCEKLDTETIDYLHHNWSRDSKLEHFVTAAMTEYAVREKQERKGLYFTESSANDMLNVCVKKLIQTADVGIRSDILNKAWEMRYGSD